MAGPAEGRTHVRRKRNNSPCLLGARGGKPRSLLNPGEAAGGLLLRPFLPTEGARPGCGQRRGRAHDLASAFAGRNTLSGAGSAAERLLRPLGTGPSFGQQGSVHQGGLTASSAGWPPGPGVRRGPGWWPTCRSLQVMPAAAGAQTECAAGAGWGSEEKGSSPNVSSVGQRLPVLVSARLGSAEKPGSAEASPASSQGAATRLGSAGVSPERPGPLRRGNASRCLGTDASRGVEFLPETALSCSTCTAWDWAPPVGLRSAGRGCGLYLPSLRGRGGSRGLPAPASPGQFYFCLL